jgi:hypothetical protein
MRETDGRATFAAGGGSVVEPWTTDILTQHATPRAIATALCEQAVAAAAAPPVASESAAAADPASTVDAMDTKKGAEPRHQRKPIVDEAQRQRAVAKSAARRAAKNAGGPRLTKAERRYSIHS